MLQYSATTHVPVIWMTGLPASGKTTLSGLLHAELKRNGISSFQLDGDAIRNKVKNSGFSKEARHQHCCYVAYMASVLQEVGVLPIVSLVSPYRETREYCRSICKSFYEIYLESSIEVCISRDYKKNYEKARAGIISHFTGVSSEYEAPLAPDLLINTENNSLEDSFSLLYGAVMKWIHIER